MPEQNSLADLAAKYVNSTDRHIFLTGKAGTGKTTFLKEIIHKTYKNAVVAAPTGIAAINAGGVTLHSLLQLPFGIFVPENIPISDATDKVNTPQTLFRNFRFNKSKRQLIQQMELLIIDEVSMLRADLLDCIDLVLRNLRRERNEPFGGLQILFIGDLLQLPPVVRDNDISLLEKYYKSPYFFNARALEANPPILVELQKVFRQSDDQFISVLNRLRNNEQTEPDIEFLNGYYVPDTDTKKYEGYIHLTTHNYKADSINETRLKNLPGKSMTYNAEIQGDFKEHLYPTNETLVLKEGAQVMFIKNDPTGEGRFFNGKIGKVISLEEHHITVQFENGVEVYVDQYEWENKRYTLNKQSNEIEEKFLGKFIQYPIKLAWAVTVHKSQGLTFEKAILDLSGTFAPGQLYVALSRLTSLEGLVLSSKLPANPPGIEESLYSFVSTSKGENELGGMLEKDKKESLIRFTEKAFQFDPLLKFLHYHLQGFNKAENRSAKQHYLDWTNTLRDETRKLNAIGSKFIQQVKAMVQQEKYLSPLAERMDKAWQFFHNELNSLTKSITQHRKEMQKEDRVSTYVKELKELEELYFAHQSQIHKLVMLVKYEAENRELSKEALKESPLLHRSVKEKPEKQSKTPTAEISFQLFREGKSIPEIAKERGLVNSTIEGHLCPYVKSGDISIDAILDKEKLEMILKRYEKGINGLGELKSDLGDHISYGEIKLALAHHEWINAEKEDV